MLSRPTFPANVRDPTAREMRLSLAGRRDLPSAVAARHFGSNSEAGRLQIFVHQPGHTTVAGNEGTVGGEDPASTAPSRDVEYVSLELANRILQLFDLEVKGVLVA